VQSIFAVKLSSKTIWFQDELMFQLIINHKMKYKLKIMSFLMTLFIQQMISNKDTQEANTLWHWWTKDKLIDLCMEIMDLN